MCVLIVKSLSTSDLFILGVILLIESILFSKIILSFEVDKGKIDRL